jgi:hypothetical protein
MIVCTLSFVAALLAIPPAAGTDDLGELFKSLQEAVSKKDAALVKNLAIDTFAAVRKTLAAPEPEDETEKDAWKKNAEYALGIELQAEYALLATAIASPPAMTVELIETLEKENPKSRYLNDAYGPYVVALHQTGASARIPAIAEKAIANFPENEDLLLVLADARLARKQVVQAGVYAERLLAVAARHPRPENVPAQLWEKKRTAALTRCYWIAGLAHMEKAEYQQADKDLRMALPLVKGNEEMLAATLFNLGLANYHLGRLMLNRAQVLEAAKFSDQAAALKSPHARQAWTNAHLMRQEAAKMLR